MWFAFSFHAIATWLGIVTLATVAAIAWYRERRPPRALQLIGGLLLLVAITIGWFVRFNIDAKGQIEQMKWWRAQEFLSGAGLLVFAAGYWWERLGSRRKSRRTEATTNGQKPRGTFYETRTIVVSLPRLDPDDAATCPISQEQILEHATTEFDDGTRTPLSPPVFVRTARIGQTAYWLWTFNDPRRGDGYIVVALWPGGRSFLDADDTFDMTPEQFLVAEHFNIEP